MASLLGWDRAHLSLSSGAFISLVVAALALLMRWHGKRTKPRTATLTSGVAYPPSPPWTHPVLGHHTYPPYDAPFNLRLSYLYGPIVLLHDGTKHPLAFIATLLDRLLPSASRRLPVPLSLCGPQETTVLLNGPHHSRHILDRLGAHYSSRARSIAAGKYLSDDRRIVLKPYDAGWRTHYRALMVVLSRDKLRTQWDPVMRYEAAEMVLRIADLVQAHSSQPTPVPILKESSRFTASSVLQIAYARRAATPQDPILAELEQVSQGIAKAFEPGRFLVERVPLLDYLPTPLAPWRALLQSWHRAEYRVYRSLISDVQDRLAEPPAPEPAPANRLNLAGGSILAASECATSVLLATRSKLGLDLKDIAYIAATIFEAGTETTAMTINTFLLAVACHPPVAQKLRDEIDAVGGDAVHDADPPGFDLFDRMPYLSAVLKETLRFTPTGSSGVAHLSTRTDVDDLAPALPFALPPQCTVLPNIYGIHRTAEPPARTDCERDGTDTPASLWRFDPTRHLAARDAANQSLDLTPSTHAFGFGRRKCPGSVLASHSLWVACAFLLFAFEVRTTVAASTIADRMAREERAQAAAFRERFPQVQETEGWREERREKEGLRGEAGLLDAYTTGRLGPEELERCIEVTTREDWRIERVRAWTLGQRARAVG